MDDLVAGAKSDEEAPKVCREPKEIVQQTEMTLRKWTTNLDGFNIALKHDEQTTGKELAILHDKCESCPSFECMLQTFHTAREQFPEFLLSYEVMNAESVRCVRDNLHLRLPLDGEHPFYLLIKVAGVFEFIST
ncbi:hypothetical protein MRX96_050598 [Rhipicephalus microplus]